MNTLRLSVLATLTLAAWAAARAEVPPAWTAEDFIMEEVVVKAQAPASFYMEEIVVTAEAPAHLYMEEIVVTAKLPEVETTLGRLDPESAEESNAAEPIMEEIVVTASRDDACGLTQSDTVQLDIVRRGRRACSNSSYGAPIPLWGSPRVDVAGAASLFLPAVAASDR